MQGIIVGGVAGLVMVGVLVVVHEAGHFLMAKLFRIGAPVFSVGMGPRLFGFQWRGTDYRVSALPIGGYVRMAGADPFGEEDPDDVVAPEEDFMRKPVWQRLLVMLAGPAANLILPFVVFTGVFMLGEPQLGPEIGMVLPGRPAEQLGLRPGDVIVEASGQEVAVWADFVLAVGGSDGDAPLTIEREGEQVEVILPSSALQREDGLVDTDILGVSPFRLSSRIGVDDPASPAGVAGLHTGDGIVEVDGAPVDSWDELVAKLTPNAPHRVKYLRAVDGAVKELEATVGPVAAWSPRADDPLANAWGIAPIMVHVGAVVDGMPAQAAGIRPDDRLYRIDGELVRSWSDLVRMVGQTIDEAGPEAVPRPLQVELVRQGQIVSVSFAPKVERELVGDGSVRYRPLMGIQQYTDAYRSGTEVKKYYSFFEAVPRATRDGAMVFESTVSVLGNLATGEIKPSEGLGGPIEIFRAAGEGAKRGIFSFARLLGTISFSLGLINLLPVPVLDGGQIVFYTIEGIRGRPLSLELRERVQMVGVLALAAVMLMVTVMDVNRWLGGG